MDNWPGPPPKWYDYGVILKLLLGMLAVMLVLHYALSCPWLLTTIAIVVATAVVLAVVHVVVTVLRVQYANRWGPPRTVPATVARKWTEEHDLDVPTTTDSAQHAVQTALGMESNATLYEDWGFWVAFEVEGRQEEFEVPESVYVELEEGQEGILTYRGERLIRFVPLDEQGGPPDDASGGSAWRPGPHLPRPR